VFTEENLGRKDAGIILVDVREGCVQMLLTVVKNMMLLSHSGICPQGVLLLPSKCLTTNLSIVPLQVKLIGWALRGAQVEAMSFNG
jgi:hypothetical protein